MPELIEFVGPNRAVSILGVKLVGFTAENGKKLLFTLAFILLLWLLARLARKLVRLYLRGRVDARSLFWSNQAISIVLALVFVIGFVSVWFDDPARLATALGLVSAGLAFALQRVVTSVAGYFIILRGRLFNVGDRISMGGVRGDVIGLGFTVTTVMEMGQPPSVQLADPAMWVEARQYTGRIVTITNDKVFDTPVYNYTREFPYLWEELHVMIPYEADRQRAEHIILDAAGRHTERLSELGAETLRQLERHYLVLPAQLEPRVYYRLTDNWLELSVRFIARADNIRAVKDAMSRDIVEGFDQAGLQVASATIDVVKLPPVSVQLARPANKRNGGEAR